MHQQINLYQPIFSEQRPPLSALMSTLIVGLVATALLGFSVQLNLRIKQLAARVESLHTDQSRQEARLAAAQAHIERSNTQQLQARVQRLAASLSERKRALQLLQSGAAGQTIGFAARLEALAHRHVEGLWIDRLIISGTNGSMSLAGAALDADRVPVYLQSLAQERALRGTRFDEFMIERPDKSLPGIDARADADAVAGQTRKPAAQFIRFRAGNKALPSAAQSAP